MAAAAGNLTCKVAPLAPSRMQKAVSREARLIGVVQEPLCTQCRVHMSLGLTQTRQVSARRMSATGYATKRAGGETSYGSNLCLRRGAALRPGLPVSRGLQPRRSVRVRADEPSDAEKEVQVKETLLRDALEEKSKKGEESKPAEGFKGEGRHRWSSSL